MRRQVLVVGIGHASVLRRNALEYDTRDRNEVAVRRTRVLGQHHGSARYQRIHERHRLLTRTRTKTHEIPPASQPTSQPTPLLLSTINRWCWRGERLLIVDVCGVCVCCGADTRMNDRMIEGVDDKYNSELR